MKHLELLYDVFGGKIGDGIAQTYRDMLNMNIDVEDLNEAMAKQFLELVPLRKMLTRYCNSYYKIESFVAYDICEELQTYHYL